MPAHPNPRRDSRPRRNRPGAETVRDRCAAGAALGAAHPLVRVLAELETVGQQLPAVAAVNVLALTLWWAGLPGGFPLVAISVFGLVMLGCRRMLLVQRRRELCLDLIVACRAPLPLAAVARESRRLLMPHYRACLARTLEDLARVGEHGRQPLTAQPWRDMTGVRCTSPQLRELAWLLRRGRVSARAVAVTEELLASPESPLYGSEPELLRQELGRVRSLLRRG